MISNHDRSGWFGASDCRIMMGNMNTKTFKDWWLVKLGLTQNHFHTREMSAGTHKEHQIIEYIVKEIGYEVIGDDLTEWVYKLMDKPFIRTDKQIKDKKRLLRINLDGNSWDTVYEIKTYKASKGFKVPKYYWQQVQLQMFITGYRNAFIVAYGLNDEDYENFFLPIDEHRLSYHKIDYDEKWINEEFLPRVEMLADCLKKGCVPYDSE